MPQSPKFSFPWPSFAPGVRLIEKECRNIMHITCCPNIIHSESQCNKNKPHPTHLLGNSRWASGMSSPSGQWAGMQTPQRECETCDESACSLATLQTSDLYALFLLPHPLPFATLNTWRSEAQGEGGSGCGYGAAPATPGTPASASWNTTPQKWKQPLHPKPNANPTKESSIPQLPRFFRKTHHSSSLRS